MGTKIEWAEETWNPIRTINGPGYHCTKVSEGCQNCYAEKFNKRFGNGQPFDNSEGSFYLFKDCLEKPLHWKKPRKIFVQSMGDLFHEDVPDEFIAKVWDVMWKCSQHTFLVLTKRPERMKKWVEENAYAKHFGWGQEERAPFVPGDLIHIDDLWMRNMCGWEHVDKCDCNNGYICDCPPDDESDSCEHGNRLCMSYNCPIACSNPSEKKLKENGLEGQYEIDDEGYSVECDWMEIFKRPRYAFASNVWLGVTAENQARADERIPVLLQTPTAKRFVSIEPMLGSVDLSREYLSYTCGGYPFPVLASQYRTRLIDLLDWVICGGETGPGARPMHPDWVRSLRDQCQGAGTPFFFKSWGDWAPEWLHVSGPPLYRWNPELPGMLRVGKKKAGRLLDGRTWDEMPGVES